MTDIYVVEWKNKDGYIQWGEEHVHYPESRSIDILGPFTFTPDNPKMYPIEDEE